MKHSRFPDVQIIASRTYGFRCSSNHPMTQVLSFKQSSGSLA